MVKGQAAFQFGHHAAGGALQPPWQLVHLCVLLGFVERPKLLHVFLDVLLGLVLDVLIALQVFGVLAGLQLLVHHTVSQLWREGVFVSGGLSPLSNNGLTTYASLSPGKRLPIGVLFTENKLLL